MRLTNNECRARQDSTCLIQQDHVASRELSKAHLRKGKSPQPYASRKSESCKLFGFPILPCCPRAHIACKPKQWVRRQVQMNMKKAELRDGQAEIKRRLW